MKVQEEPSRLCSAVVTASRYTTRWPERESVRDTHTLLLFVGEVIEPEDELIPGEGRYG